MRIPSGRNSTSPSSRSRAMQVCRGGRGRGRGGVLGACADCDWGRRADAASALVLSCAGCEAVEVSCGVRASGAAEGGSAGGGAAAASGAPTHASCDAAPFAVPDRVCSLPTPAPSASAPLGNTDSVYRRPPPSALAPSATSAARVCASAGAHRDTRYRSASFSRMTSLPSAWPLICDWRAGAPSSSPSPPRLRRFRGRHSRSRSPSPSIIPGNNTSRTTSGSNLNPTSAPARPHTRLHACSASSGFSAMGSSATALGSRRRRLRPTSSAPGPSYTAMSSLLRSAYSARRARRFGRC
ncbi:hypothetical protein JB92DRAFT_2939202, partial [Gautieria morchelliformis]